MNKSYLIYKLSDQQLFLIKGIKKNNKQINKCVDELKM